MRSEHWKAILDCTDISETRGDAVIWLLAGGDAHQVRITRDLLAVVNRSLHRGKSVYLLHMVVDWRTRNAVLKHTLAAERTDLVGSEEVMCSG